MTDIDLITPIINDCASARRMMANYLVELVLGSVRTQSNPRVNAADFPTALNKYCCARAVARKFIEVGSYDLEARKYGFLGK